MMINRISTNAPPPIATICHTYSIFLGSGSTSEQEEEAVVVGDGINGLVKAGGGWVDEAMDDLEVLGVDINEVTVGDGIKALEFLGVGVRPSVVTEAFKVVVEIEDELSVVFFVFGSITERSGVPATLGEGLTIIKFMDY